MDNRDRDIGSQHRTTEEIKCQLTAENETLTQMLRNIENELIKCKVLFVASP